MDQSLPKSPKSPGSKDNSKPVKVNSSAEKKKQIHTDASQDVPSASSVLPTFITERNQLFEELKKQNDRELLDKPRSEIKITLYVHGTEAVIVVGKSWETTPGQLLRNVPKEVSSDVVIAKVDGNLWDLDRLLEQDCKVEYLSSRDPEGRSVFWHSSAHVLGEAAENEYGCRLSHGPPTSMGFFYDMALEEGRVVKESDWAPLEAKAKKYAKDKQPFDRLVVSKENLRKMFGYSKYKMHYIEKFVPDGEGSTVYRNGSLVDLCQGPHIQNTRKIEAFKIQKNSSAYFLGDQSNDSLQRIHGVAFPKKDQLKEWEHFLEEAKKRDHQLIGKQQKLWMFSQLSPGSPFLLPHGTRIFNALQAMLREEYWKRGYHEVQTPNMYDKDLWMTSGHWQHYSNDMFRVQVNKGPVGEAPPELLAENAGPETCIQKAPVEIDKDKGIFGLKPMNCPGHCLMFRDEERSYRELPWRVADFGVLHRNEASGALSGLTRVRKFQQDDTHVFCTLDQVTQEIAALFDFLEYVYGLFGFPFKLKLSTRPEDYLGDLATWNDAEARLKDALNRFKGNDWTIDEGDGAFYGPKIDITISDSLNRAFQCATIQLDFMLPQNFKLEYMTAGPTSAEDNVGATAEEAHKSESPFVQCAQGRARPVMIHRAIIGSFERFMAILTEHYAGKWPFWLSPRQILVVPVMKDANSYAEEVRDVLHRAKFYADVDVSGNTMKKKILNGQMEGYNFTFIVGAEERNSRGVNIRNRDDQSKQKKDVALALDEAVKRLQLLRDEKRLTNTL
ncbi:MAG: hypothetical protein Q9160_002707 [Pyrenula sp. 1 TL-2023]